MRKLQCNDNKRPTSFVRPVYGSSLLSRDRRASISDAAETRRQEADHKKLVRGYKQPINNNSVFLSV